MQPCIPQHHRAHRTRGPTPSPPHLLALQLLGQFPLGSGVVHLHVLRQPLHHCGDSGEGGVRRGRAGATRAHPPAPLCCPRAGEMHGRAAPRAPRRDGTGAPVGDHPAPTRGDGGVTRLRLGGAQPGLGRRGCLTQLRSLGLLLGPLGLLLGPALCSQLGFALAPRGLLCAAGAIGRGGGGRGVSSCAGDGGESVPGPQRQAARNVGHARRGDPVCARLCPGAGG